MYVVEQMTKLNYLPNQNQNTVILHELNVVSPKNKWHRTEKTHVRMW